MPKNDDLINDILRELDDKKDNSPAEEPAEAEPVQEEPAESFEAPYTERSLWSMTLPLRTTSLSMPRAAIQ